MYLLARDKIDVEVLPIPKSMLAPKTIAQPSDSEFEQALTNTTSSIQRTQNLDLQITAFGPGNTVTDSHLIKMDGESNSSQTLLFTTTNNELKVESKQPGVSDKRTHLHVLSLPESFKTENTAVNLHVPSSLTDSLRVVFNKRAAESYSLSDGRQIQHPSIVEKKLKSITQIEETVERCQPVLEDKIQHGIKLAKISMVDVSSSRMLPGFDEDDF